MAETLVKDNLVTDAKLLVTSPEVLASGNLAIGAVLGKKTIGAVPTTGTADGGNTGNGTVTSVVGKASTKVGNYILTCVAAVTNGGTFEIKNPDGAIIGQAIILAGAGGIIAFSSDELDATITDGSTDFNVDDFFTVAVPAGDGELVLVDSTKVDGTNKIHSVLSVATDASGSAQNVAAYIAGGFNEDTLVFGGTDTKATHKDDARILGIHFQAAQAQ